ncbi:pcrA [Symbiodinium natans]|uniref:PcrA protein n=1 Tax=Symbiodinium natans TaxID=878477 RepID=A0A812II01_9DINO|nr:pcrA [Symbiodinium natans]
MTLESEEPQCVLSKQATAKAVALEPESEKSALSPTADLGELREFVRCESLERMQLCMRLQKQQEMLEQLSEGVMPLKSDGASGGSLLSEDLIVGEGPWHNSIVAEVDALKLSMQHLSQDIKELQECFDVRPRTGSLVLKSGGCQAVDEFVDDGRFVQNDLDRSPCKAPSEEGSFGGGLNFEPALDLQWLEERFEAPNQCAADLTSVEQRLVDEFTRWLGDLECDFAAASWLMGSFPSGRVSLSPRFHDLTAGRPPLRIPLAERRGIQLKQLEDLLRCLEQVAAESGGLKWRKAQAAIDAADVNLYDLCDGLIKPLTLRSRCSYVEAVAESEDKQVPSFFVSHWWGHRARQPPETLNPRRVAQSSAYRFEQPPEPSGEPVASFVAAARNHGLVRGRSCEDAYWVCAYANNQHDALAEIGSNPKESPFFRALRLVDGVLLILDGLGPATPFRRMWCCFEKSLVVSSFGRDRDRHLLLDVACTHEGKPELLTDGLTAEEARMEEAHRKVAANSSGWLAKSQREGTFPVQLLQEGFQICIQKASASREEDRRRILNVIAGKPDGELDTPPEPEHSAYQAVDRSLRGLFAVATWRTAVEQGRQISEQPHGLPLASALRDSGRSELTFHFSRCHQFSDEGLAQVVESLPQELRMLSLQLEACQALSPAALMSLGRGLQTLTACNSLDLNLSFTGICSWESLAGLSAGLRQMPQLQVLVLEMEGCTGMTSLDALTACLPSLQALRCLRLGCARLKLHGLGDLGEKLAQCPLQELRLDFSGCGDLESLDTLAALEIGSMSRVDWCFPRCTALMVRDDFWKALHLKSLHSLRGLSHLSLNFAHCLGLQEVTSLGLALEGTELATFKVNFHYCSALAQHLQWSFLTVPAFQEALAKGGQGRTCVRDPAGKFQVRVEDSEEEEEEDGR